jgi:SAM-dependent methyltransferase
MDEHSYFDFLQAQHSLDHFFSCSGMSTYIEMLNICQNNNIEKVYDIGCGFGWQSEIFLRGNVKYVGIDRN